MTPVVVTLPDGSAIRGSGTPVRDVAAEVSPRLAKAALAARGRRLVDLSYPLTHDAQVQILTADGADALKVYRHRRAPARSGRHEAVPGNAVRHQARSSKNRPASTTSWSSVRSCPRISRRSRPKCAVGAGRRDLRTADVAARRGARVLRRAGRAAEGAADRGEHAGTVRGFRLHHQGPRDVRGLLPRAARAVDGQAQGLQADGHIERLLEGRREESADAAGVRHGLLQRQGPAGAWRGSRKRRSGTIARWARNWGCSCSTRGRLARRSGCTGHRAVQRPGRVHAQGALPGWL